MKTFETRRTAAIVVVAALFSTLLALVGPTLSASAQGGAGQAPAARAFPATLAPYEHPRVFATAAELPAIKANLTSASYGAQMSPWLRGVVLNSAEPGRFLRTLAELDITSDTVTAEQIDIYFLGFNERSAYSLGVTALWGAIFDEGDAYFVAGAAETAIGVAVNHGILMDHTHERYRTNNYAGLSDDTIAGIKAHWVTKDRFGFDLSPQWRNGSIGMALAYDLHYNDMSEQQRALARRGLSLATAGWNLRGGDDTSPVGFDGNAVSNHYGYQGDQLVMMAAIYGEDGFSQDSWDQGVQIMQNYMRVGWYDSGYPLEDGYGPNLGLREGSRGLIAMARQGANEFDERPSAMYNIGVAAMVDVEAIPNGSLIGGESGGNYSFGANSTSGENPNSLYPTFFLAWKYLYPDDPTIDALYQWRVGDDYQRQRRWQGMVDYAFFGQPYAGASVPAIDPVTYFPQRGKLVVRDDLSDQAVQFAFDARPDASNIGHDKAGRGYFSLNALGRRWVSHIDFRQTRQSTESSTMHIDGAGQAYKTPSVRVVSPPIDDGLVVSMVADLEYAYDWQWNEPWTWSASDTPRPSASDWEQETIDPRTFYQPGLAPAWLSATLWDDRNQGYAGQWMWRRPNIDVERAFRSVAYVRGANPFVIIADDIQKDADSHRYESYMQLPFDLDQLQVDGKDAVLSAAGDDRRLLVRVLDADTEGAITFTNESYSTSVAPIDARRLIIGLDAVNPNLKVMLYPHRAGDELPETTVSADGRNLVVGDVEVQIDSSNGYPLFSASTEQPPRVGDVNCDDELTLVDALMISQYAAGQRTAAACPLASSTQIALERGDIDGSGAVDAEDSLAVLRCLASGSC